MRIALAIASAALALCPVGACSGGGSPAPPLPFLYRPVSVTMACWDEPNAAMPSGMERMGGDVASMPAGAVLVPLTYPNCGGNA